MQLSEDAFRALARSSPWRWRSMHFTRRGGIEETVEAWINRPGELIVVDAGGRRHRQTHDAGENSGLLAVAVADGGDQSAADAMLAELREQPHQWGGDLSPVVRLDGLVAHRPGEWWSDYEQPFWENYRWAAMLDPVELADGQREVGDGIERCDGTVVTDLREGEHRGRPAWRATVAAGEGYNPTCGCCPLLWSRIADRLEYGDDAPRGRDYPIAYEVALDLQTAVVVELVPLGGERANDTLDVEIHEAR
ncbi:hypothetical protein ACLM5J_01200 [Nocardioides sp. Bht2]|uniref:hypothetical protein n=1 Tax=Nocardioides sp. Bht2 TaxID=3392297 RepID=UPI0039B60BD0